MARTRKKGTIFFPAKHKSLADAISISSPSAAYESIRRVKRLRGFTRRQKISALVLAANRAKAMLKRKNLSPKERREMKKVAEILMRGIKRI